jgi:hypothetical protein
MKLTVDIDKQILCLTVYWLVLCVYSYVQGDQKVYVHLMITIQKVTSNVQNVPRQSTDIYWH